MPATESADRPARSVFDHEQGSWMPVEHVRSLVRLLYPDEMTPTAKRMIESACEEYEDGDEGVSDGR